MVVFLCFCGSLAPPPSSEASWTKKSGRRIDCSCLSFEQLPHAPGKFSDSRSYPGFEEIYVVDCDYLSTIPLLRLIGGVGPAGDLCNLDSFTQLQRFWLVLLVGSRRIPRLVPPLARPSFDASSYGTSYSSHRARLIRRLPRSGQGSTLDISVIHKVPVP